MKTQATGAVECARRIVGLRERYLLAASAIASSYATVLADLACEHPILAARTVEA